MIHKNISYGYDFDQETNTLVANSHIENYGFFSTFTLMLSAIINTYRIYNVLPNIDGSNILRNLQQEDGKDMYSCFFETDHSVEINVDKNLLETVSIYPDMHHDIYNQKNLDYILPFFKRYFKINHVVEWKLNQLIGKYNVKSDDSLSVIIRGTDKWTDFGGIVTIGPGAYVRIAEQLVKENPGTKVLLQTEHGDVVNVCQHKFPMTFFEETKTTTSSSIPIFFSDIENKLDWAEWYVAALWLHARSKYVVTYSGNSAFFVCLARGSTQNFYQDISFKIPPEEFFIKNVQKNYGIINLKMSVGEIIDRYSICLLKSERLQIDVSDEINALQKEISNLPREIQIRVAELKEINGQIWTLEADLRNGNESAIGYEEIGKRAIQIRNLNNQRVAIKNNINSIVSSGFIDVKGDHISAKKPSLVVTLSTVPERLKLDHDEGLKLVLRELCEQNDNDYEVHFNIPHTYNVTGEQYIIPEWLNDYKRKYPHLRVYRTKDVGPPTKVLPTISRVEPETIILVVDDDLVYHRDMIKEHRKWQSEYPDSAIVYEGRGSNPYYNDIRDAWVLCVTRVTETHGLQHYKSASYKSKLFTDEFWKYYVGKTLSDDVLIGRYFRDVGVLMYSVPYEPEVHLYATKELWDKHNGVTTFPIVRPAASVENTGCNNTILLSQQPKFYEPADLGNPNKIKIHEMSNTSYDGSLNLGEFGTDKISHGYLPVYKKVFDKIVNCEKILEIGAGSGESLRLFSAIFPTATIHGIDLNAMPQLHTDKIIVHVGNQENREDLNRIVQQTNEQLFDIILDDGCHQMLHQQVSFGFLFKYVKAGGYYIIEDLHTSRLERFEDSNCVRTTLDMLLEFDSIRKIVSNYMTQEEITYLEENIEYVHIWSRTDDMKESVTAIIKKIN